MKPAHNHESDWLVSFFILLYLLVSQVKAKFSSILNSRVKHPSKYKMKVTAQRFVIGVTISITNVSNFVHRISLLRRRSKAAHLYMAVFHFVLGMCKVTVNNQTIFTKEQKMRWIISQKKKLEENQKEIERKSCSLPAK